MKAMILAAGLGTRLLPLTEKVPKALIEVNGIPLIEILINKLKRSGITQIIVNVHYHADQVVEFLNARQYHGVEIAISDETCQLLDTGGGIKKARWFLHGDEPFIVHNVDVISGIDFNDLLVAHKAKQGISTLAVSERKSSRYLMFNKDLRLAGWENTITGEKIIPGTKDESLRRLAFSGIHIIDPAIFTMLTNECRFPIIDEYLRLISTQSIYGYDHTGIAWYDLGKKGGLAEAGKYLGEHPEILLK